MRALLFKKPSLFILFTYCCGFLHAATLPNRDFQGWLNYTMTGGIYKPFRYWLETQERGGDNVSRFSQGLIRPGLGYSVNREWSVWLGYAWIYTAMPYVQTPVHENRIWQQALWVKPYRLNTFIARTRLEQRFIQQSPNMGWRLRQLAKAEFPLAKASHWSLVSSDEVFVHLNSYNINTQQGFDQNRCFLGFGYRPRKHVLIELGYMNQYIKRSSGGAFSANIASLNFLAALP